MSNKTKNYFIWILSLIRLVSANFLMFLFLTSFVFASFAVSATDLEYNQLELKGGKIITFVSLSKIENDAMKVILTNGQVVKLFRKDLSDDEIKRRFAVKHTMQYGRAYLVKSKLPKDFNLLDFKNKTKPLILKLKKRVYNAFNASWKRVINDESITNIDKIFLPDQPLMSYYYFLPNMSGSLKNKKYPLVVFLHGAGECGNDKNQLFRHPQPLIFIADNIQKKNPCFFVAPQLGGQSGKDWVFDSDDLENSSIHIKFIIGIVDEMLRQYPNIDRDQIYLSGLSSGGIGALQAISMYPNKFAGVVLVATDWVKVIKYMKNKQRVAIWSFMNSNENKELRVDAVKLLKRAAKLGADARYTKFEAAYITKTKDGKIKRKQIQGHFAWVWAYAEPDLIPWLFAHKREKNSNTKMEFNH